LPLGSWMGWPSSEWLRRLARVKAITPMAIAPAITRPNDGSQDPAISRKPSTFAGLAIPATRRPMPNTRPAIKAKMVFILPSKTDEVAKDINGEDPSSHKGKGRDQ